MSTLLLYAAIVTAWLVVWHKWAQHWPTWAHALLGITGTTSLFLSGNYLLGYFFTAWLVLGASVALFERREARP